MEPEVAEMTDARKAARIKAVVTQAGESLMQRYPLLEHQDALGLAIQLTTLASMVGCAWLYLSGVLAWWLTVPLMAMLAAITHEMEHDLIHFMYYKKNRVMHNLLMLLGWLARPSTLNPWIRRKLHFHHHQHSGTPTDLEERAITNGERWGVLRLIMTGDNILAILLRLHKAPDWRKRARMLVRGLIGYFPLGWAHWGLWHAFIGFHAVDGVSRLLGAPVAWEASTLAFMDSLRPLMVCLIAPNVLRTFSLHFVSSNMHYYGDVEAKNLMHQTQVFNAWRLLPLQLFCFNFGATHSIHHFAANQPFYIRQLVAKEAHQVMREVGVPFNDFGTFRRANRRGAAAEERPAGSLAQAA